MNTTIIQVPISKTLRNKALEAAATFGFSSIQDVIRVFLSQFASRKIGLTFGPAPVKLSVKNNKRYTKMIDEVLSGKVKTKTFSNIDNIMDYLHK